MKKALSKGGFTLIELMLVALILAVIGTAVFGTFANGLNIWKKATGATPEEDISLFLEKISFELRNSFKFTGIPFRGSSRQISIPLRVRQRDAQNGAGYSVGRTTYYFDGAKKTLSKSEEDYSDVFQRKSVRKRELMQDVSSLEFKYFVYDSDKKQYTWLTQWQERDEPFGLEEEENLPLLVSIEIGVEKGKSEEKFVNTVRLPSACCWPLVKKQGNDEE